MSINKATIREQADFLLGMERIWKDHLDKQDSGSYCENASTEFQNSREVWQAIKAAREAVQRYGGE